MMEIKSEDGQSYTMPLDSVSRRLDVDSEYCRVQIGTEDDSADCYSEDTFDTVKCHICNVEVPVLCFKRHTESEKHVSLKTIFKKVLERVSKQINISVINKDEDLDNDVYFCVPCSKIVMIKNQPKHESSVYHVKSRKDIDVVHEFYKVFEENKGDVGVKETGKEENLDEKRDLSANFTEIIQNHTKNNNVTDVTNEDKTKIVCPANDHTNTKPGCTVEHLVRNEKHYKEPTSEEKYFKDMVKKYYLMLPIVDGDFIQVASPSGIKVKISRDHYHSYQSVLERNRVYCQMCTTWFELGAEEKHKVTEKHVRNVFLPINEKFTRSLNDNGIHCLICNKVTRLQSMHICQNNEDLTNSFNTENIGQTHSVNKINKCFNNEAYISKLDLSENYLGNPKGLVFCELCNVSVPQDQIEYHNAGTPHWSNAFKNICTSVIADGLQAYFFKDSLKTDSDLSGKQNDIHENDNVAKQHDMPENDKAAKQNDISENDNEAKQNDISENNNAAIQIDIPENDNETKQNDISENNNAAKQNDIPENDNAAKQNDNPENDNVAKQNDMPENDNAAKQNDISEHNNAAKQNDIPENDNEAKQNDISENDNEAKQNDIHESDNAAKQNDIPENDNAAKQNDITENDNVAKQNYILENDNAAKQNVNPENDNVAKQNDISENDNVAKQNDIPENDNAAKQNDNPENENVAKQNDISENDNVAKQNDIHENDNAASSSVSNIANYANINPQAIGPSRPFRFADPTKNRVTCIVCDIDIPNDSQNIYNHKESSNHEMWLKKLFMFHTVNSYYSIRHSRLFYDCNCCNISRECYNFNNVWDHIGTEKHTALLQYNFNINPKALKFFVYNSKVRNGQGIMYKEFYKVLLQTHQIFKVQTPAGQAS